MKKFAKIAALVMMMTLAFGAAFAAGPKTPANDQALRPGMRPKRTTVIDFNATWCGPCRMFAPAFDKVAEAYRDVVVFISVDIDQYPETANAFNIQAVPTIVIIDTKGKSTEYVGLGEFLTGLDDDAAPSADELTQIMAHNLKRVINSKIK